MSQAREYDRVREREELIVDMFRLQDGEEPPRVEHCACREEVSPPRTDRNYETCDGCRYEDGGHCRLEVGE